jgi:uncharacterized membrane protein YfcA
VNTNRVWFRNGWAWLVLSVVTSLASVLTFALGDRDWVAAAVQWTFIGLQFFCIVRMIACFRSASRDRRGVSR